GCMRTQNGDCSCAHFGAMLAVLWGVFLAVSSNARYQVINGLESVVEASPLVKQVPLVAMAFTVGNRGISLKFPNLEKAEMSELQIALRPSGVCLFLVSKTQSDVEPLTGLELGSRELFKIRCRAYEVIDHIIPKSVVSSSASKDKDTSVVITQETWSRLDSIVLQWIYNTIFNDLLHTILAPDPTAKQAWDRLKSIFQDNKHSRALYLEQQFTNLRLDNFSNVFAYCQELKVLADQLSNVGSPVSNDRLVLQLVAGLNESYDSFASHLQHTDPLPQFYEARSRLILEETRKKKQAVTSATTVGSALLTTTSINNSKANQPGGSNHSRNTTGYGSFNNTNNTRRRGGGRNTNGRGHGLAHGLGNMSRGRLHHVLTPLLTGFGLQPKLDNLGFSA
ncbi:retrovirus-related pol polyprotein from transposon TNT 1-94, partial [Tanacetum coccineum]